MRKASSKDIPSLIAMMAEFYAESDYTLDQTHATQAFATLLADERFGHVWFIQSKSGQDAGFVVVTLGYSMEYGGPCAYVDDLFIRPAFRGAGLATVALTEVRDFCLAEGIRAMHVETGHDNTAAQSVYQSLGFVDTERMHLTLGLASPSHLQ